MEHRCEPLLADQRRKTWRCECGQVWERINETWHTGTDNSPIVEHYIDVEPAS